MNHAVNIKNLHASYYGNEVLKDISFEFEPGRIVGIIGPNGAGKSTMIKAILGLIPKDRGDITICDKPVDSVRKKIAYVPQRSNIDWDFPINVFDTVLLGTYPSLGLFKRPGKKEKEKARESLERVGMLEYANQQIGELSGGQQQRVFMARALSQDAEVFFLDEPFVGIDIASEKTIMNILKDLRDEGKTVFVVHHDLSKVHEYFDDLILINKSLIKYGSVASVFTEDIMQRAYQPEVVSQVVTGGLSYATY